MGNFRKDFTSQNQLVSNRGRILLVKKSLTGKFSRLSLYGVDMGFSKNEKFGFWGVWPWRVSFMWLGL